jgi:hypothetical protein
LQGIWVEMEPLVALEILDRDGRWMQLVYGDAEHVRFGKGYQDDDQGGELVVLDGAEVGHEGH